MTNIRIGDSYKFSFIPFASLVDYQTGAVNSLDGWTCSVYLKTDPSASASVTKSGVSKNDSQTAFEGTLLSSDTSGLSAGVYFLVAEMTKASTTENVEKLEKVYLSENWN